MDCGLPPLQLLTPLAVSLTDNSSEDEEKAFDTDLALSAATDSFMPEAASSPLVFAYDEHSSRAKYKGRVKLFRKQLPLPGPSTSGSSSRGSSPCPPLRSGTSRSGTSSSRDSSASLLAPALPLRLSGWYAGPDVFPLTTSERLFGFVNTDSGDSYYLRGTVLTSYASRFGSLMNGSFVRFDPVVSCINYRPMVMRFFPGC